MITPPPQLRHTVPTIHPLAGSIVHNVLRDWRASLAFFLITQPSPFPSLNSLALQLLILSALLKSSALSDEPPMARSYHSKPCTLPCSSRHSSLPLLLLLLFSLCCPTPKCFPLRRTPPQYLAELSPGASLSDSSRGDTGSRPPSRFTLLALGGAARTEVRMASRWGTMTLRTWWRRKALGTFQRDEGCRKFSSSSSG